MDFQLDTIAKQYGLPYDPAKPPAQTIPSPSKVDQAAWNTLKQQADQLAKDPSNTQLRTAILTGNVALLAKTLNVDKTKAGTALKSYTSAYAKSKNIDPKQVLEALTTEEQNILNYSASNPKLYGMDLVTANKLAGYLGLGSGFLLTSAIVLFTIALFTVGPEVAGAIAAGEGVVATIASLTGNTLVATGGFLFLLSQFLGHLSSGIPMMTKQMIDNGSIGPGLRITAIKQAEDLMNKLGGGSGFGGGGSTVQYVPTPYMYEGDPTVYRGTDNYAFKSWDEFLKSGGNPAQIRQLPKPLNPSVAVVTGAVANGIALHGVPAVHIPNGLIETLDDLKTAANANLASYAVSLADRITFELKFASSIIDNDGVHRFAGSETIVTGYAKSGAPKERRVVNRFALVDIYLLNERGKRVKIDEVVLGAVNAGSLHLTRDQQIQFIANLNANLHTNQVHTISATAVPVGSVATPGPVSAAATPGVNTPTAAATPPPNIISGIQIVQNPDNPNIRYLDITFVYGTPQYNNVGDPGRVQYNLTQDTFARLKNAGIPVAITRDQQFYTKGDYQSNSLGNLGNDPYASIFNNLQNYGTTNSDDFAANPQARQAWLDYAVGGKNNLLTANTTGLWQIEISDAPGGKELIYYPKGITPDPKLRYPGAPAPSITQPTTI